MWRNWNLIQSCWEHKIIIILRKIIWQFLKRSIINLPTVIPLLGISLREMKAYVHTKSYTRMHTAALFVMPRPGNTLNIHHFANG